MPREEVSIRSFLAAWFGLLRFDWLMKRKGFTHAYQAVKEEPFRPARAARQDEAVLSHAVDLACVFYFKQVHCLQRSAALAVLLKRSGARAEMVVGAQLFPFQSHAWVEVDGRVINDKPYVRQIFQVLDRC